MRHAGCTKAEIESLRSGKPQSPSEHLTTWDQSEANTSRTVHITSDVPESDEELEDGQNVIRPDDPTSSKQRRVRTQVQLLNRQANSDYARSIWDSIYPDGYSVTDLQRVKLNDEDYEYYKHIK